MHKYLVVAHQTATDPHLVDRAKQLFGQDPEAVFAILVPATRVEHLLTWERGESEEIAQRRAYEARRVFEATGIPVSEAKVGDEHPVLAIEDELRAHPADYHAVLLSTLPPGRSRWLEQDVHRQAERRIGIPLYHVYNGSERDWAQPVVSRVAVQPGRLERLLQRLTEPGNARGGSAWDRLRARGLAPILAFMGLYLTIGLVLAVTVDRGFLLNDLLAIVVFGVLLLGLLALERRRPTVEARD